MENVAPKYSNACHPLKLFVFTIILSIFYINDFLVKHVHDRRHLNTSNMNEVLFIFTS